jgi:ubiquinone/menaquinone biosynthesis C-methylase UbiE
MADEIKNRFPGIQVQVGDCQKKLDFRDDYFDRILAIHVLEHLPNLPAAVAEMYRLYNKGYGVFSVVIPCDSMAYTLARRISAQRIFEKRYKQSYRWLIEREHLNRPDEIIPELRKYFTIQHGSYFPLSLPFVFCNLCLGMTLRPKTLRNATGIC